MFWLFALAHAGFGPLATPHPLRPAHGTVIATSLAARVAPNTQSTVAYSLPIGSAVQVTAISEGWARLETGFWVDLRFIASLEGTMEAAVEAASEAASTPEAQAVWRERAAALAALRAQSAHTEQQIRQRQARFGEARDPSAASLRLAPPQEPGSVTLELHPDEPIPAELWVLPQRGVARRGRTTTSAIRGTGCGDDGDVRDVRVEVDLGAERAIAFSTADLPPDSWRVEAPAQEHTAGTSTEILDWLEQLARGRALTVHTSAIGAERWIAAGFPIASDDPEMVTFDMVDIFASGAQISVRPFWRYGSFEDLPSIDLTEEMPSWFRDLDGDGQLEVLFLGRCSTRATDRQKNPISSTSTRCCGC